jgi:hypothetical protein
MVYLQLDSNNIIIGHGYELSVKYNTPCKKKALKGLFEGVYRYKYIDGELIELTQDEIDNHPNRLRNNVLFKIDRLVLKHQRLMLLKEVKSKESLSAEEVLYIDEEIDKIESTGI